MSYYPVSSKIRYAKGSSQDFPWCRSVIAAEHTVQLGLAISDKKIIPWKTEWTEQLVCSGGIPAVPRNRKLSEFRSEPFLGIE